MGLFSSVAGFSSPGAKALRRHGQFGTKKVGGVFQNGNVAKLREMFEKKLEGDADDSVADTLNVIMGKGPPGGVALPGLARQVKDDDCDSSGFLG